jgi:glycosyltransferase involved in cell wall biosynthesis
MKKTYLSIVIPVYDENESLRDLVKKTEQSVASLHKSHEYIFVDDGSTDGSLGTLKYIKEHTQASVTIIRFRKNLGKSAALAAGFARAQGDIIVTLDADLQDDPGEIPALLKKLANGYDMIVGWRTKREDKMGKIRLSKIFNAVVSKASGVSLHDMNCGLKVFKKAVIQEISLYGELHRYIPVMAYERGFKVGEMPVLHHERKFGSSKFGANRIFHASFDLVTTVFLSGFKTRPLQIFGPIGLSFIVLGIIPLMYLSYIHFLGQSIGTRPLLQLGILFMLFGVQLFSTGLIGELITSLHFRKEKYPIEEIIE